MATIVTKKTYNDEGVQYIDVKQDGVEFSNISTETANYPMPYAQKFSYTAGGSEQRSAVNAVDIDWNNAKLGSTTIKTTGDLLSYISSKVGTGGSSTPQELYITFG